MSFLQLIPNLVRFTKTKFVSVPLHKIVIPSSSNPFEVLLLNTTCLVYCLNFSVVASLNITAKLAKIFFSKKNVL